VADWPNLIDGSNIDHATDILSAMTAPLAGRILLAHFKDANRVSGQRREVHHHVSNADLYGGVEYPAPGLGSLDLAKYAQWLRTMKYDGAVIIEHVEEAAVPEALRRTRAAFFQGATNQAPT
jgi:sugar phosphate isomerase/epimerase